MEGGDCLGVGRGGSAQRDPPSLDHVPTRQLVKGIVHRFIMGVNGIVSSSETWFTLSFFPRFLWPLRSIYGVTDRSKCAVSVSC